MISVNSYGAVEDDAIYFDDMISKTVSVAWADMIKKVMTIASRCRS
jgi:hypothetical protein